MQGYAERMNDVQNLLINCRRIPFSLKFSESLNGSVFSQDEDENEESHSSQYYSCIIDIPNLKDIPVNMSLKVDIPLHSEGTLFILEGPLGLQIFYGILREMYKGIVEPFFIFCLSWLYGKMSHIKQPGDFPTTVVVVVQSSEEEQSRILR